MFLLKHFFDFDGRLSRGQYFFHQLILLSIFLLLLLLLLQMRDDLMISQSIFAVGSVLLYLGLIISELSAASRRFQDMGRKKNMIWLLFVPFVNAYWSIVLLFKRGEEGRNIFGEDPLELISSGNAFNIRFLTFIFLFTLTLDILLIYFVRN